MIENFDSENDTAVVLQEASRCPAGELEDYLAALDVDQLRSALAAILLGQKQPREVVQAWIMQQARIAYQVAIEGDANESGIKRNPSSAVSALKLINELAGDLPTREELAIEAELLK